MLGNFRSGTPPVVKNLLVINILMFIALIVFEYQGINLNRILGLFYFDSEEFQPYQIISHMFMHGGIYHIFFNMFALWMFGSSLEQVWGPKRFFIFYMVCGLGAALLHSGVNAFEIYQMTGSVVPASQGLDPSNFMENLTQIQMIYSTPTVGASGAVFGLLLGFGMIFPNTRLMLIFLPIPIKAKYFVIFYGLVELTMGIQRFSWDNIAHFAHIGGMLFGFILIKLWKTNRKTFY